MQRLNDSIKSSATSLIFEGMGFGYLESAINNRAVCQSSQIKSS